MHRIWRALLGLDDRTALEDVELDDDVGVVVAHVRPKSRWRRRCGRCGRRSPVYDHGDGRRRWRGLDLGTVKVFLEADAPRVSCRDHGVVVAQVLWARHAARQTRAFEDTAAWLVTQCSKTAVTALLRISWRTVGGIVQRVMAELDTQVDRLDGLTRIGIDEISYKRGQNYLTVVVDHDTGRLVWVGIGRNDATIHRFFDDLGEERSALITHISADGADAITRVAGTRASQALLCADAFHVVSWATPVPRRCPPAGVERGPPTARRDDRGRLQGGAALQPVPWGRPQTAALPLGAVEGRRRPHRPSACQARLDRQDLPDSAPRLPAQRRTALRLRRQRR